MNIEPPQFLMIVASIALGLPLSQFALKEIWKRFNGDQKALGISFEKLHKEMQQGFRALHDLLTTQKIEQRELSVRMSHVEVALEKLEARQTKGEAHTQDMERRIVKEIEQSRKKD